MAQLVLVRHGESTANRDNIYTGWSDVPLTAKGEQEAKQIGAKLATLQIPFSACHTSVLTRAIMTSYLILDQLHLNWIPLYKTWRLNERHYGALRGLNKAKSKEIFGVTQIARWRRSFTSVPPMLETPDLDRRYQQLDVRDVPRGESLKMAAARLQPYYDDQIVPRLMRGEDQLVVAHGSSLRALLKYIENISDTDINGVEVQNGEAIIYSFDEQLNLVDKARA
ncbi:2,3-diphosphoglycerate-dependent phosphoglycerate mutase [Agrilactobacillus yilanensis]|uniref:2,3-bisphosphoglycerate-dependent phosphoglycerate mutase n=1 Tax=Agrilactobacillus yilanensis TaxID=2485997 RepID=A0ABW4J9B6_9LACO|nr:2,3-bisphosphoglycerate-dependent phosphoglycerate mutase [Agrilactobacillus yilanensis]